MPTFLGPTNMPLLEAQTLGAPVICSDFEGHREICAHGAEYVDPSNAEEIRTAMKSMLNVEKRTAMLEKAKSVSSKSGFTLANALVALNDAFIQLRPVRKTFP
jgi:glycosyltransferase involved in cell wall biosynthesis